MVHKKKSMALPSSVGKQQELQEHNLKSLSTYSPISLEVWWPVSAYALSNFVITPKEHRGLRGIYCKWLWVTKQEKKKV